MKCKRRILDDGEMILYNVGDSLRVGGGAGSADVDVIGDSCKFVSETIRHQTACRRARVRPDNHTAFKFHRRQSRLNIPLRIINLAFSQKQQILQQFFSTIRRSPRKNLNLHRVSE